MKTARVLIASALIVLFLAGCDGVKKESEAWRDQLQETVIALQESLDAVALAVPGERWARQMEALTDPNPAERQRALDELASGVGASLGKPLTVRASIGSTDSGAIRARFFLTPTNQISELESFCQQGAFISLDSWKNGLTRPRTSEERSAAARGKAQEVIDQLFGVPQFSAKSGGGIAGNYTEITWSPRPLGTETKGWPPLLDPKDVKKRRSAAVAALADLMLLHYEEIALDNTGNEVEYDWSSVEGHGVLHVVMPRSDLERLDAIRAWIHEKDQPSARLDGMTPRRLTSTSFKDVPEEVAGLCLPEQGEPLSWAAVDLARSVYHSTPSAQVVQQLARLRESVEQLKEIYEAENQ